MGVWEIFSFDLPTVTEELTYKMDLAAVEILLHTQRYLDLVPFVHYDDTSLNAETRERLPGDGPRGSFQDFEWVLVHNGSPLTIVESEEETKAPACEPGREMAAMPKSALEPMEASWLIDFCLLQSPPRAHEPAPAPHLFLGMNPIGPPKKIFGGCSISAVVAKLINQVKAMEAAPPWPPELPALTWRLPVLHSHALVSLQSAHPYGFYAVFTPPRI
ncbi:hypothetical protein DPX16_6920 [Anabarilius grahami]|uniref:Uncharacterized protein n=1 Tax=Anabarilius grahami TaxID=495550 RepID=A0A3N0Y5P3_ANAGA|nr:hypothetical protein DPX16_6920 [Anabarilius grahami]